MEDIRLTYSENVPPVRFFCIISTCKFSDLQKDINLLYETIFWKSMKNMFTR